MDQLIIERTLFPTLAVNRRLDLELFFSPLADVDGALVFISQFRTLLLRLNLCLRFLVGRALLLLMALLNVVADPFHTDVFPEELSLLNVTKTLFLFNFGASILVLVDILSAYLEL